METSKKPNRHFSFGKLASLFPKQINAIARKVEEDKAYKQRAKQVSSNRHESVAA
jgi:hypothetical protein